MIIGLAGSARSGKDTVGTMIQEYNHEFRRFAFATAIKKMLVYGLGLHHDEVYGENKDTEHKIYKCTPRHMMQTLGTEWGRNLIHPDIWLLRVQQQIAEVKHAVITDVRFNNEANTIRQKGGVIWHIYRESSLQSTHASEAGVRFAVGSDLKLFNSRTLEDLQIDVVRLLQVSGINRNV